MIKNSILECIGNTPMVRALKLERKLNLKAKIILKLESFNPSGSVKDRASFQMIFDAMKDGRLNHNTHIIEPTSGNTGIGLAMIGAYYGMKVTLVMPSNMSVERQKLMRAYGAQIVLTDASLGMKGAIEKAVVLSQEDSNSFIPSQFENLSNKKAHILTTAEEIWRDTMGAIDVFIAGVGTGGTISGVAEGLKAKKANVEIVAVEPSNSAVLSNEKAQPHKIQGIGAGFIPDILNLKMIDKIIKVDNEDAFKMSRLIAQEEGILVGISSGAALEAAYQLAQLDEYKDKNIVVLLPDTGERYLSTELFDF